MLLAVNTRIKDIKVLPEDGKPVSEWTNQNRAWLNVIKELERIVKNNGLSLNNSGINQSKVSSNKSNIKIKQDFDEIEKSNFQEESDQIFTNHSNQVKQKLMKTSLKSCQMHYTNANILTVMESAKQIIDKLGVNARNDYNYTIMHSVVFFGDLKLAEYLIKNGFELNSANDSSGNTGLHLDAIFSEPEIAKLLIKNGADVNALNNLEETPLDLAKRKLEVRIKYVAENPNNEISLKLLNDVKLIIEMLEANGAKCNQTC